MHLGFLIQDLFAAVERVEQITQIPAGVGRTELPTPEPLSSAEIQEWNCSGADIEPEGFSVSPRLNPADRNLTGLVTCNQNSETRKVRPRFTCSSQGSVG